MAALSIRDLDDEVKQRPRVKAARHGRSMEAEVRAILTDSVSGPIESNTLFTALLERIADLGGMDLELPTHSTQPRAADLSA